MTPLLYPTLELLPFGPSEPAARSLPVPKEPLTWDAVDPRGDVGDGSTLPAIPIDYSVNTRLPDVQQAATRPVPFLRILKRGSEGRDVLAVERTLHQLDLRKYAPSFMYGWRAMQEIRHYQQRHNLEVTGTYGAGVHRSMAPQFDAYSRWLYTHPAAPVTPPSTTAERTVHAAFYLYAHRPWVYHETRPAHLYRYGEPITKAWDCSWFATNCRYLAGAADPSGYDYAAVGNTYSMCLHGTLVSSPVAGDMVFYANPAHVGVYVGNGSVIEFGNTGGPYLVSWLYRAPVQVRRYQ